MRFFGDIYLDIINSNLLYFGLSVIFCCRDNYVFVCVCLDLIFYVKKIIEWKIIKRKRKKIIIKNFENCSEINK